MKKVLLVLCLCLQTIFVFSQDSLLITTDIVSRYVFRGQVYGGSVNLQPKVSFAHKNLEVGVWGTYGITDSFHEVDPFVKYSYHEVSATFVEHYDPTTFDCKPSSINANYFNFNNSTTAHLGEVILTYEGPISLLMSTYIYGNDLDSLSHNRFSTYFELGYTLNINKQKIDLFFGMTPHSGSYANDFAVVNVGATTYKDIKIADNFTIPTYYTLIINPKSQNVYFVVGLTL